MIKESKYKQFPLGNDEEQTDQELNRNIAPCLWYFPWQPQSSYTLGLPSQIVLYLLLSLLWKIDGYTKATTGSEISTDMKNYIMELHKVRNLLHHRITRTGRINKETKTSWK
jgi:hypothetical protein